MLANLTRLIALLLALPSAAWAGAGGTFAFGGTTSVIVGLIALAIIVIVILRARRR